ncbi:hypothetical protein V8D89_004300 [Ganoderma adspersum]
MPMKQKSLKTFPFPDLASSMPVGDCAGLEGLSPDEIRVWALRKSEEYRLLSYTMLSLHNAAAPIHTLPVEILMKIFGMTWTAWDQQGLRLTSVCRRWRRVYLATPEFWAEAVAGLRPRFSGTEKLWYWYRPGAHRATQPPPECVAMLLERSWPHPIPLYVGYTPEYGPGDGATMITIPTHCVLHSTVFTHPIHAVKLCIYTSLLRLLALYHILKAGMPALEELELHARREEPPDLARTLASLPPVPDESLPRLRSLSRPDPAIFFPLIAVRSLEDVHLDAWQKMTVDEIVPWPHPPGSQSRSFLRALARCTNLEYLYLEYYTRSRWWPPLEDEGSDAIYLPSLKGLSFVCDDGTEELCAQAILEALDPCIPSTAFVDRGVLNPSNPDSLSQLMPAYLVQHHPFNSVIISPSGSRSETYSGVCCLAGQELRLNVLFSSTRTLADLGIEDVFRTTHVTHLEIIIPGSSQIKAPDTDPVENWAGVLRAFPHLTHLTVSGADTPDGVVDALGAVAGHGVAAGTEALASEFSLCPALRYVTVGWQVPREIGPKETGDSIDLTAYRQDQDVRPRVEQRCSILQLAFERRASMGAQNLHALEFYEYERQGYGWNIGGTAEFGELIASSRRDDSDLPCLERLRAVVGGPVVYRGYLLKMVRHRS